MLLSATRGRGREKEESTVRSNTAAGCPEMHTLGALVTFNIWVQIIVTNTDRDRQMSTETVQKYAKAKREANKQGNGHRRLRPAPAQLQTPPPHQSSVGVVVVLNRMQPKTRSRGVSPFITRQRHLPSSGLLCEK